MVKKKKAVRRGKSKKAAKKRVVRKKAVKKASNKSLAKKAVKGKTFQKKAFRRAVVPRIPPKPKKKYKLPNYKKKCISCGQFKFIKGGWSLCMPCYEKRYGRYLGEDRYLYIPGK
ncbi:hypothetical protein JW711_04195 [Candidatus Woesearchaeota archaeon]|nr:hypothetical protein [Candidatus Woesearchaeota archaeon]